MEKVHVVIVIFEAKPGKEGALEAALSDVVGPSRSEASCLEYRLHKSNTNPAEFVLYENWESQEKHQEQFQKPYIIALGQKLEELLVRPYQVIFSHELHSASG